MAKEHNTCVGLGTGLDGRLIEFSLLQTMTSVFDKFKEKKQNVVSALRDAADAVYLTVSI